MKLVYKIPGKLYYIQQFLDYPTYKKIHYDSFKSNLINLNSSEKKWEEDLVYGFKKYVKHSPLSTNYSPLKKIKILLENNPFCKINFTHNFNPMFHSIGDGAGINWHDDRNYRYGITYYINRRWNKLFGGEFAFKHEHSNGFIPLVGNSIVIIKGPFEHKVVPVMKPLVPRKSIQIFVK